MSDQEQSVRFFPLVHRPWDSVITPAASSLRLCAWDHCPFGDRVVSEPFSPRFFPFILSFLMF